MRPNFHRLCSTISRRGGSHIRPAKNGDINTGQNTGVPMARPYILVFLLLLLTGCENGECRKCMEEAVSVSARYACSLSLQDQGQKDSDAGWTVALDDCTKKGIVAALKNENNRRALKERCARSDRCGK